MIVTIQSHVTKTFAFKFFTSRVFRECSSLNVLKNLTYELSPSCINNHHGLRARAIRTLYMLREPFTSWLQQHPPFSDNLDSLVNHQCHFVWSKETEKNLWNISFKFKRSPPTCCSLIKASNVKRQENIHANTQDGCCVMRVVTEHFIPVPPSVMGQFLHGASLSVGQNMRYHKLKLKFGVTQNGGRDSSVTVITLDSVLNAQIFAWWHPAYPCQIYA